MKLRNFLRIMIPVCALATVSCTNEELILEASQTQRGRDFAQAFKARFDNIDPNHTWVDGTVGKVTVTTDEKANITIYGLGRSDNAAIRLKRCVVEGTQEVHYDIPMGCEKVVIRAWNEHGNAYKTLNPSSQEDEAQLMLGSGTRATSLQNLSPQAAEEIPNVWNAYGTIAPWESDIPNIPQLLYKHDGNLYGDSNKGIGMCYYFPNGDTYYNIFVKSAKNITTDGIFENQSSSFSGPLKQYFVPTGLFDNSDEVFCKKTGLSLSDKVTQSNPNGTWQVVQVGWGHANVPCDYKSLAGGVTFIDTAQLPAGWYFNFNPYGKRASWINHKGENYGHFYVTNINISDVVPDLDQDDVQENQKRQGSDYLDNTQMFYNIELNGDIIDQVLQISRTAEAHPAVLKEYNEDEGLENLREGPVTVTWFYSETTTRDYVGYYYTVNDHSPAACNRAPKYLLLEASATTTRKMGDTFPLTYYGENYNSTPQWDFPAGARIHFFVLHGRDSSSKSVHPSSGPNYNSDYWDNGWKPWWGAGDPRIWNYTGDGTTPFVPESHNPINEWLFYDTGVAKKVWDESSQSWVDRNSTAANGWTLNTYYACYSHGGSINNEAVQRIYGIDDDNESVPDDRIFMSDWMNGNYTPMVAFKYAGYNVIGFEDTPIKRDWFTDPNVSDLDWNDCIFIVNGNFDVPTINERDLAFSMCMEDLGDTDDLDYNDLYMVVIQGYEEVTTVDGQTHESSTENFYAPPKVIVDMAGGILPLKITYEDELRSHLNQTLFEDVHKAFGIEYAKDEMKYATVGQRSTINTFDPNSSDPKNPHNALSVEPSYSAGEISKVSFSDGAVVRCTNVRSLGNSSKNGHIETWFDANKFTSNDQATFSIIENIPNFKIYVKYNEGESDEETICISGPKSGEHNTVNIGVNTDKIPYAFWFPSTAESEQASEANPDSRVHPGFERQFIGNYLEGFNDWVADQTHANKGKTNWYNWMWGESDPDNNQGSGSQGGGNENQLKTKTINITASAHPDYYEIAASQFSVANTTLYVKLNYTDTENYKWSNWVVDGSTILNPSGILENYVTEDLTDKMAELKQKGLRIEWWANNGNSWNIPSSIQIIYK